MLKVLPYLKLAVDKSASDIYFTVNSPAMLKIEGEMFKAGEAMMTNELIRELAMSMMTPEQVKHFDEHLEIDLATDAGGLGRFRINVFTQRNSTAMVLRYIKSEIPTIDGLHLPEVLKDLVMLKRGMILMVGATGCGKTTTLAAMIGHRNDHAAGHILTVEDPIEFVHPNRRSIINQREVGTDTVSYERALKSSMREAPDVILIGEVRVRETMDAVVQLSNTGHLTLSTLHANNAYQAMQRMINLYPDELRDQLYMDLSMSLRAIVSQRLVRRKDGRRTAAVEVLINTPYIAELIMNRRIEDIKDAMANSSDKGMLTYDASLFKLYNDGFIELEEALVNADSRTNLAAKINFGFTS